MQDKSERSYHHGDLRRAVLDTAMDMLVQDGNWQFTLREVARRLESCVRSSDTVARVGGDEFVAVLSDMNETSDCLPLLNRLLSAAAP